MSVGSFSILIADDDAGDRKQVRRALKKAGFSCEVTEAKDMIEAMAACEGQKFDCAIVDYHMPGHDGLECVKLLHEKLPYMGIIMATGQGDETVAAQAFKLGVNDYMPKNSIDSVSLKRVLEDTLAKVEQTQQNEFKRQILESSVTDLEKANTELEKFAYVASHDLQEPLRKLQQFALFLNEDCSGELSADASYFLNVISDSSSRMSHLIQDILCYSRSANRDLNLNQVDLNLVGRELLSDFEILISETDAKIKIDDLPVVQGDPAGIDHLIRNLIGNAIKYHHPERAPEIELYCLKDDGRTKISVRDNGIGIDMQFSKVIFEPFQRLQKKSDYPGSGIGLAICTTICERHGWSLEVDSEPGKGSVFSVIIPDMQSS